MPKKGSKVSKKNTKASKTSTPRGQQAREVNAEEEKSDHVSTRSEARDTARIDKTQGSTQQYPLQN
ncbi:MAG TPA: hypothetical protein VIQ31_14840 [Phormidium sp.]